MYFLTYVIISSFVNQPISSIFPLDLVLDSSVPNIIIPTPYIAEPQYQEEAYRDNEIPVCLLLFTIP